MNQKLLKLALDSGLVDYVEHETPRVYFISGLADIEDVEKFAELIVRECCDVAKETRWAVPPSQEQIASGIQQHFGVEE